MQVFINGFGKTVTVDIDPNETIYQLKDRYHRQYKLPSAIFPSEINLIWAGHQLEDNRTLASYNILKESTLHWSLRFPGYAPVWSERNPNYQSELMEILHPIRKKFKSISIESN